jgi:hypothetical protein
MNKKEVFINTDDIGGTTAQIKYVLSDNKYFLIKFADKDADEEVLEFISLLENEHPATVNLDTGEIDIFADPNVPSQYIYLWTVRGASVSSPLSSVYENTCFVIGNSVDFNEVVLDLEAPIELTFNPSKMNSYNKIYKIEYGFKEGTQTQTLYYSPTSLDTLNLPFSAEPGDPRNYPKSSTYTLTDEFYQTFYTVIKYYTFDKITSDPNEVLYTINLKSPSLDGQFGLFDEVHLVYNKMFDFDNKVLYVFESYNPQYLLPSIIKWESEEQTESKFVKAERTKRISIKPYRFLQPFEDENQEKQNITSINLSDFVSYKIDEGYCQQYNLITQDQAYYIRTASGKRIRIGNYYNSNINLPQPGAPDNWILADTYWNDNKLWIDDKSWKE